MTLKCILLLFILLSMNFIIFKVKKYNNIYLICTTCLLLLYFLIIIYIDKSNMNFGFEFNIFVRSHDGISVYDEHKYFAESKNLYDRWTNGYFMEWFNRTLPDVEYQIDQLPGYGNYNYFVVFLAALRLIGLSSASELILFKLIFTVFMFSIIFDLCNKFVNSNRAMFITMIFALYPAFIQTNVLLLRDNILLLLILILIKYLFFESKENLKSPKSIVIIILSSFFLFKLRLYTLLVIYFTAISLRLFKNTRKLISMYDIFIILSIILGYLIFLKLPIGHFQLVHLQKKMSYLYGTDYIAPIKLMLYSIKDILTTSLYFDSLTSKYLYVKLTASAGFFYIAFIPLFIYKVIILSFFDRNVKSITLVKSTLYFCFFNSLILMAKDGFVTARLNTMWFLLFLIIIFIPSDKDILENKLFKKIKFLN